MLRRIRAKPNALRPRTLHALASFCENYFAVSPEPRRYCSCRGLLSAVTRVVLSLRMSWKRAKASCVMTAIECLSAALKDMGKTPRQAH